MTTSRNSILILSCYFTFSLPNILFAQPSPRWMAVGSLHSWYSPMGCEEEEGFVKEQQYGLQWPAIYQLQDMQVAKALWIAVNDHVYSGGTIAPAVAHIGPRVHGINEFFPITFEVVSKFDPPQVKVNGVLSVGKPVTVDRIDSTIQADRMIINVVNTAAGITMTRKITQFSQQYHDNYILHDYVFTNTGNTNQDSIIEYPTQTLTGVYFYFLYRNAICADTRYVIGQNPTGWGINTMNDIRGDGNTPAVPFFTDPIGNGINYDLRALYSWHGKYPPFTSYDNIGGPVWTPYYDKSDTVGRLGAAQFVGVVTIHADKSALDVSDDPSQPSTTSYEGSDEPNTSNNDFLNSAKNINEYAWITRGHRSPRHADKVGPTGDPAIGTPGGWSSAIGYGPYILQPGQSIHIMQAEAAAGLSHDACVEIGRKYKGGGGGNPGVNITYSDGSKINGTMRKNDWVYTGRDSLFLTFNRAIANANSGYAIPQPPKPPKTFNVALSAGKILLTWDVYGTNDPLLKGFEIYRAEGRVDSTYRKIYSCGPTIRSFTDSTMKKGTPIFYYIVSVGDAASNNGVAQTPAGALVSGRFYTQTFDAVTVPTTVRGVAGIPTQFSLQQNYPNPFNPSTTIRFDIGASCRVELKVYDALGRVVATLVSEHLNIGSYSAEWNANALPSGMYFYRLSTGGFVATRKMLLVK